MEGYAVLKYAPVSLKKMKVVASMIRGKSLDKVKDLLKYLPHKSAYYLLKVVKTAENNLLQDIKKVENVDINNIRNNLVVKEVILGNGPKIKRYRYVSRGRMHGYVKQRTYVKIIVGM